MLIFHYIDSVTDVSLHVICGIIMQCACALLQVWSGISLGCHTTSDPHVHNVLLFCGDLPVLDLSVRLYRHSSSTLYGSADGVRASVTVFTHSVHGQSTVTKHIPYGFIPPLYRLPTSTLYSGSSPLFILLPPLGGVELGSLERTPKPTSSPTP